LSKHYRSPVDFSDETIKESERGLERLYMTISDAVDRLGGTLPDIKAKKWLMDQDLIASLKQSKAHTAVDSELAEKTLSFPNKFFEAMNNDFNTAQAIGLMFDLRNSLQRFLESSGRKKLKGPAA
ncbi:MAG: DALR domain-containing protein, partial [Thermodesulforhabdaceae bacterium]